MSTGNHTAHQNMVAYFENVGIGAGGPGNATLLSATGAELNVLAGATAGTAVASKAMVLDANKGISGFRNTSTLQEYGQAAPGTLNATGTLTAALMLTGIVTSTTAAAVTATLDTGTLFETGLIAIYPGLQNNDSVEFTIINTGANGFTIATATGWTDGGNAFAAVAFGTSARFLARRTAANTYTLYKIA
jgi:hypothetical protein